MFGALPHSWRRLPKAPCDGLQKEKEKKEKKGGEGGGGDVFKDDNNSELNDD